MSVILVRDDLSMRSTMHSRVHSFSSFGQHKKTGYIDSMMLHMKNFTVHQQSQGRSLLKGNCKIDKDPRPTKNRNKIYVNQEMLKLVCMVVASMALWYKYMQ